MTPTQYRKALDQLGLSQLAAGRLFKVSPRTAQNWAAGTTPIPESVALYLEAAIRHHWKLKPEDFK